MACHAPLHHLCQGCSALSQDQGWGTSHAHVPGARSVAAVGVMAKLFGILV